MGYKKDQAVGGLLTGLGRGILLKEANVQARQAEARKLAALYGGRTAGDGRLVAEVVAAHTTETIDGDVVDKAAVHDALIGEGRDDLARIYAPTGNEPINKDSDEWLDAGIQAEAEMNEKAGWWSTDKTDFADHEGSRTRFKTERQEEIYNKMMGRVAPTGKKSGGLGPSMPAPTGSAAAQTMKLLAEQQTGLAPTPLPATDHDQPMPKSLKGKGTAGSPYKLSAQGDDVLRVEGLEWFHANAKPGERIIIDGETFEKRDGRLQPVESAAKGKGTAANPIRPKTKADFDKIKAGEHFVDPGDGQTYTK